MEKEPIVKSPRGRKARTPVGTRNILSVQGKDPAYEYRIVNDEADRIAMFEDAGYVIEDAAAVRIGDKRVERNPSEGSKAMVSVGKGDKAFLMKIPKEFYLEDQQAKLANIRKLEESIKNPTGEGQYGGVSIETK